MAWTLTFYCYPTNPPRVSLPFSIPSPLWLRLVAFPHPLPLDTHPPEFLDPCFIISIPPPLVLSAHHPSLIWIPPSTSVSSLLPHLPACASPISPLTSTSWPPFLDTLRPWCRVLSQNLDHPQMLLDPLSFSSSLVYLLKILTSGVVLWLNILPGFI